MDTFALLIPRNNEQGANRISELLSNRSLCYGSFMTLMEAFCRVGKDEVEAAEHEAYTDCFALPMNWIHESHTILQQTAVIKATHP